VSPLGLASLTKRRELPAARSRSARSLTTEEMPHGTRSERDVKLRRPSSSSSRHSSPPRRDAISPVYSDKLRDSAISADHWRGSQPASRQRSARRRAPEILGSVGPAADGTEPSPKQRGPVAPQNGGPTGGRGTSDARDHALFVALFISRYPAPSRTRQAHVTHGSSRSAHRWHGGHPRTRPARPSRVDPSSLRCSAAVARRRRNWPTGRQIGGPNTRCAHRSASARSSSVTGPSSRWSSAR